MCYKVVVETLGAPHVIESVVFHRVSGVWLIIEHDTGVEEIFPAHAVRKVTVRYPPQGTTAEAEKQA
jgi:hypothetical protein